MEQFSLEKWLQDKSRKVIDDDGFPVEIIKWDANEKYPVVYLNHNGIAYNVSVDGMYDSDPNHGLFFADEKEELTEFEKELIEFRNKTPLISVHYYEKEGKELIHNYTQKLFDLARKEILKGLPKWRKSDDNLPYPYIGGLSQKYLVKNGYYIKISDLETLPKEE